VVSKGTRAYENSEVLPKFDEHLVHQLEESLKIPISIPRPAQ
jgi:hypothetical protein